MAYCVTVERLHPAAGALFIVRGERHAPGIVASGTRTSSREAMFAGEYVAEHIPVRSPPAASHDDGDTGSAASAGLTMT